MKEHILHILKYGNVTDVKQRKKLNKICLKSWVVSVSKDALINSNYGWYCDCGRWTFGDNNYHVPVGKRDCL